MKARGLPSAGFGFSSHSHSHYWQGPGSQASRPAHTRWKKSRSLLSRFVSVSQYRIPQPTPHAHGAHRQWWPVPAHGPHAGADDPHGEPADPHGGVELHGPHGGQAGTYFGR
jgi:hypothetical protein